MKTFLLTGRGASPVAFPRGAWERGSRGFRKNPVLGRIQGWKRDLCHALVPFREAVSSAAEEIDLASRVGETETGYSCGTAPDSHRLRLAPAGNLVCQTVLGVAIAAQETRGNSRSHVLASGRHGRSPRMGTICRATSFPARGPASKVTTISTSPVTIAGTRTGNGTRTECVQKRPHINPEAA
jgi:hypothetical protein